MQQNQNKYTPQPGFEGPPERSDLERAAGSHRNSFRGARVGAQEACVLAPLPAVYDIPLFPRNSTKRFFVLESAGKLPPRLLLADSLLTTSWGGVVRSVGFQTFRFQTSRQQKQDFQGPFLYFRTLSLIIFFLRTEIQFILMRDPKPFSVAVEPEPQHPVMLERPREVVDPACAS